MVRTREKQKAEKEENRYVGQQDEKAEEADSGDYDDVCDYLDPTWTPSPPPKRRHCQDDSSDDSTTKKHLVEAWRYHRRMRCHFRDYYAGFGDDNCWMGRRAEEKGRNLRQFHGYVWTWALEFGLRPEECAELTSSQKRTIIASLEGQCVQEEWDTLHKLCPSAMCHQFHIFFIEALVIRDIYNVVVENPFWYFDGKLNEQDEGLGDFGARVQYLFERFVQTNEMRAAAWLAETMRLANAVRPLMAHNLELGQHHEARRNDAAVGFAKAMLESEPLQYLLKKLATPEQEEGRFIGLVTAYREAARCLTDNLQLRQGVPKIWRSLAEIGGTYLDSSSLKQAHYLNWGPDNEYDLKRLDGSRILIVTHPCVLSRMPNRYFPASLADEKAVVVVEDPDAESENNPQRS
ncbi:hypothetical protein N8T08_000921 [Aspergillus melleus]|uniref:Uncharacterized protein n=1 Tax=Aspergillus melleus TaxID=138277 RepID=A0ACC3BBI5_9EURO|nr:hypothetical protein N8T08_000921 [Aspergillus melleus]